QVPLAKKPDLAQQDAGKAFIAVVVNGGSHGKMKGVHVAAENRFRASVEDTNRNLFAV
ncbi:MAG: hypothetical protein GWN87_13045, partial [Desulfuromonadales bacterium]|nr:hypothetical protein [Desulfuromonadales bacterium]NIS41295.1 hypothetical protein [Desulfuromonadales bacterium]